MAIEITDSQICMIEMPVRNSQSPDNNSLNETTSTDAWAPIDSTSSPPAPVSQPTDGQQNNVPQIVYQNPDIVVMDVPDECTHPMIANTSSVTPLATDGCQPITGGRKRPKRRAAVEAEALMAAERAVPEASGLPMGTDNDRTGSDDQRSESVPEFTNTDTFFTRVAIALYLWDVLSDVKVAINHCLDEHYWYFGLTLAIVLLAAFVTNVIIRRWYADEHPVTGTIARPALTTWQRRTQPVCLWLNFGPVHRNLDILTLGANSQQSSRSFDERHELSTTVWYERADMARLGIVDTFVESAPQLVLQLYVVAMGSPQFTDSWKDWLTVVAAVLGSLAALSWSLVGYERRFSERGEMMTKLELGVKWSWRFFVISARVLALALFLTVCPLYISMVVFGAHWLTMLVWVIHVYTEWPDTEHTADRDEILKAAYLAYVLIISYHNPNTGKFAGMRPYYYIVVFIENCILMAVWYAYCPDDRWYKSIALYAHFGCFYLGLTVMCVYYIAIRWKCNNSHLVVNVNDLDADIAPNVEPPEPLECPQLSSEKPNADNLVEIFPPKRIFITSIKTLPELQKVEFINVNEDCTRQI